MNAPAYMIVAKFFYMNAPRLMDGIDMGQVPHPHSLHQQVKVILETYVWQLANRLS